MHIYVPYIAKIFANLFPETILFYAIGEKATQEYWREEFKIYLNEIESDIKSIQIKQRIKIRDDIIWWYLNYPRLILEIYVHM